MTKILPSILITTLLLSPATWQSAAQDSSPAKSTSENNEPGHAYRLEFLVSEMEDGKKLNSREYSMNVNAGDQNEVKIGTRVPVEPKNGEFQYLDVGTSIWCRLRDRRDVTWLANDVMLNVRSEVSNFAVPERQGQDSRPMIRQFKIDASTIAVVGKALIVGSVDDPGSRRQFQLEVTVARLR
jgi:hypothetical protein